MAQTNKITPKTPENIEGTQPLTSVNTENEESEIKLLEENTPNETSDTDLNEINPVSLNQLAKWKSEGDFEKLEFHIRNGSLEIMPKEELFRLVLVNQEHHILIESIRLFLQSIQPILEKRGALEPYIEPSSAMKINLGKLVEELLTFQMGNLSPFGKKSLPPILQILDGAIDFEVAKEIKLDRLEMTMKNNQIEFDPFMEFLTTLGLFDPKSLKENSTPK